MDQSGEASLKCKGSICFLNPGQCVLFVLTIDVNPKAAFMQAHCTVRTTHKAL